MGTKCKHEEQNHGELDHQYSRPIVNDLEPPSNIKRATLVDLCYDLIAILPLHSRSFFR